MSFYYTLFERRWRHFNWSTVTHQNCWTYLDDLKQVNQELEKNANDKKFTEVELANRMANIMEIDEIAASYCKGCRERAAGGIRIPGTSWWV